MKIREIKIEDSERYRTLRHFLDSETRFYGAVNQERFPTLEDVGEHVSGVLEESNSTIFVIEEGHQLLGFLSVIGEKWENSRHVAHLEAGVIQEKANLGLMNQRAETALSWASGVGLHRLEFFAMEDNPIIAHLGDKFGFEREGLRKHSVRRGDCFINEVWMARLI